VQWHVRFGTGTAPVNGAATTGTPLSNTQSLVVPTAASQNFALSVVVTGLTLGVPVWFDIALMPTGGGTASITNVAGSGLES
jgi:hypothetical protein